MVKIIIVLFMTLGANEPVNNYYFTAEWCSACRGQEIIIGQLEKEGYNFHKYHYETDREVFRKYKIEVLPTFIIVEDMLILKLEGKQSIEKLRAALSK